jgi:hypothetical protein
LEIAVCFYSFLECDSGDARIESYLNPSLQMTYPSCTMEQLSVIGVNRGLVGEMVWENEMWCAYIPACFADGIVLK